MAADVAKNTEKQCQEWSGRYAADFSATWFNDTLTTLWHIFNVAINEGAWRDNSVMTVKRQRVRAKKLTLDGQLFVVLQRMFGRRAWMIPLVTDPDRDMETLHCLAPILAGVNFWQESVGEKMHIIVQAASAIYSDDALRSMVNA